MDKIIINAGNIIKNTRKEKGYSTQELAKLLNVSTGLINNIENGKTDTFNLNLLYKLSEILNIPTPEIISYDLNPIINTYDTNYPNFDFILKKLIEFGVNVDWNDSKINTLCSKLIYEINYLSDIYK
ncbi:helix-turn-helix transcriptional regulator [Clostridium baratii]|uniref:HTH cro/C1-type domain-containing protein n=1 Tax=Clostridium nitritogenes TaxID=83340 RepID=A0ABN1LTV4_9CLOT|nr:helix-turn-helix transcriptional regulator [Clostridium baratii]MDY3207953.1 helix-turn-helix transcriptional regulator [Clostridium baratii]